MPSRDNRRNGEGGSDVRFPPDCEGVVRALWDYLDRALDAPTMAAIDAHLARCQDCREHLRYERTLIERIQGLRRAYPDAATLRLQVLSALHDAGMPRH